MKQILLYLLLSLAATSFAQYTDTTKHTLATDYLKKSKQKKTTGWIVFSGGVALGTISAIAILTNNGGDGLVLLGVPSLLQ